MPLARIISRSAEQSQELAAQLRARGYSVETVLPEQTPDTAADVEIKLEECTPEEALIRAGVVFDVKDFDVKDLCVFIAPGALAGTRPLAEIPLIATRQPESAPLENQVSLPQMAKVRAEPEPAVPTEAAASIAEEENRAAESARKESKSSEVYVYQDAVLSPLQRLRVPRLKVPRLSVRIPRPSFRWPSWSLPRLSVPRPWLHLPRINLHFPRLNLRLPRPSLRLPRFSLRIPRVKVRIPAFQFPRLSLNLRNRALPRPHLAVIPRSPVRWRGPRNTALLWETAVAFAILAVSLLLVGGLVHRPAPIPADLVERSQRTEQRVPFAAIKPASPTLPAPVKSAGAGVQAPQLAVEREKLPPRTRTAKPAPALSKSTLSSRQKPVPAVHRHRSAKSADADYVAQDVVVRYGK